MIGIPQSSVDIRHRLLSYRAIYWIFGSGLYSHGFLSFGDSRGCVAQSCISLAQKGMRLARDKRIRRHLVELAPKILRRVLVSGACRGDITGPLLTQTKKKFLDVACLAVGLVSQRF